MRISAILIFFGVAATCFGQYPPAAGVPGTTAIHKDSSSIVAWATGIEVERGLLDISDPSVEINGTNLASFGEPNLALGLALGTAEDVVSLGDGGIATLTFAHPIRNGEGFDFCVFENSFSDFFLELAFVEVSSDGERFVRFPSVSLTPVDFQTNAFGNTNPEEIHNLAGKYRQGFGTPFDLENLADSSGIDLNAITHVRIVDVVGSINTVFGSYDSQGNLINDPFPTPFESNGFDLEAVGVIHQNLVNLSTFSTAQIRVFPNPCSGRVKLSGKPTGTRILFTDALGRPVQFGTETLGSSTEIVFEGEPGLYFLILEHQGETKTFRVFKK